MLYVSTLTSNDRVGGHASNTAHVVLVLGQLEVSLVSPHGVPGVLDDPVLLALLVDAIANGKDSMVKGGLAAVARGKDSCQINVLS